MGVRLMKFNRYGNSKNYSYDHSELINRDIPDQHPIFAITGLQEVLNILEDSIADINQYLITHTTEQIEKNIDSLKASVNDLYNQIKLHMIQGVKDTYTVDMDFNQNTQTLKADVKVYDGKDYSNAIQILATGLYVPSIATKNTTSIVWNKTVNGNTLKELFDTGIRISHHPSSWDDCFDVSDCNAWYFDSSRNTFVQPLNTGSATGFVTQERFDYYTHTVYMNSTDGDDDIIGIIIGHTYDEYGHPHTLSIIFDRQTVANSYSLWYDYNLPDAYRIMNCGNGSGGTRPSGVQTGSWNTCGGILVQVYKEHEIVEVTASNWGSSVLNQNTKMTINLTQYSWGAQFINESRYGYFSFSQANSYFRLDKFEARNHPTIHTFIADVQLSKNTENEIKMYSDGLFAPKFNISAQSGNGLVKNTDGYYVRAAISKDADNALEAHSDGLYARDYRNIRTAVKAGHGFIVGDFIYYHPNNGYLKARGIDNYDINIVGMVTKVINVDTFEYQWDGFFQTSLFSTANGYIQGKPLYISETLAGKVTQKQPEISKAVGYPVENVGLIISIERGVQYNQEAKIGDMKFSANDFNVRSDGFIRIVAGVNFKKTLIERLLDTLSDAFKSEYLTINGSTVQFINVDELYNSQNVPYGMNLFIKAF